MGRAEEAEEAEEAMVLMFDGVAKMSDWDLAKATVLTWLLFLLLHLW